MQIEIREISLEEALPIRHKVLWPEKPIEFCLVEGDQNALHLGAVIDNRVVASASIYIEDTTARLRKFATYPELQGQGIGTMLIEQALMHLQNLGVSLFWCDARESAIGFYQRLGMEITGDRFYKSEVPYFKMSKMLD